MAENRRKSENIRRANRVIQTRTFVLMLVLGVAVFLVLALKLYQLQIKQHDYYQSKALDQQTRSTVVTASRGTIYDRNGNELAVSATAETVFLSPKELAEELEKPETKWTKESLSAGLSQLLGVTQESILEQMERTYSQYEVVKLRVDEDTANAVREFLNDNEVHGVYLETDAKRYYPYGSLAAHVIGFVGTDNTGLYGLEAQYEEELQGQTGLVVSAKDNGGNALPYEYEQYYASHNGDDLVLTLDTNVQYYLEKYVKEMADQFEAANGATGIVMDVKTGGVLGMVSYPNYDLNNYSEVSDARLKAAIEDGSASLAEVMNYAQSVQKHEIFGVVTHASAHTPGSYGVHMARVKVEKATGAVTVTDYIAVHDVGRVMNRMGIEGQLEGGIQMGLGYALREELAFDAAGQLRDSSLHSYRPFRATEMPRLQTDFIEEGEPTGPYGAKSISECAVVPSAPAIINAVCDATGLDIHDLPYRPVKAEGGIRRLHTTEGCVFCGLCAKKCPYGALSVDRQTKQWRVSDRRCRECGLCAAACPKHCLSLDNSVV